MNTAKKIVIIDIIQGIPRVNPIDKPLPIDTHNDAERLYMGAEF